MNVCAISQESWVYINCLPVYPAKKHFLNIYDMPSALKNLHVQNERPMQRNK